MPVMDGRGPERARACASRDSPGGSRGAARLLTRVSDPRAAVCLAASWMLRADVAELWEPGPDGLVLAASTEEGRFSRPAPAIAVQVIESGQTRRAQGDAGSGPVLVEPVQRGRRTWPRCSSAGAAPSARSDETSLASLALLAAQAALAIERADLAARARPPGRDRSAHRRRQPPRAGAGARARPRGRARAATGSSPSRCSISITSRPTTTPRDTGGDLLLRAAAPAHGSTCDAGDLLARYGGEEFVVVRPRPVTAATAGVRGRTRARLDAGCDRVGGRRRLGWHRARRASSVPACRRRARTRPSARAADRTVLAAPITPVASLPSSWQTGFALKFADRLVAGVAVHRPRVRLLADRCRAARRCSRSAARLVLERAEQLARDARARAPGARRTSA